jgi:hypothetical protein
VGRQWNQSQNVRHHVFPFMYIIDIKTIVMRNRPVIVRERIMVDWGTLFRA